jgi:hypothetical protein
MYWKEFEFFMSQPLPGIKIGVSRWCQLAGVFSQEHVPELDQLNRYLDNPNDVALPSEGGLSHVLDRQSGHTTGMAMSHYGFTGDAFSNVNPHLLDAYVQCSFAWHTFLTLAEGRSNPLDVELAQRLEAVKGSDMLARILVGQGPEVREKINAIMREMVVELRKPVSPKTWEDDDTPSSSLLRPEPLKSKMCLESKLKEALLWVTGDNNARFHEGQLELLKDMAETKSDMLTVARAGFGKTLLIHMLSLIDELPCSVTVFVSPLKALMTQFVNKTRARNIPVHEWHPAMGTRILHGIVVVTTEDIGFHGESMRGWVLKLKIRLARLVIDKVDLPKESSNFRRHMDQIKSITEKMYRDGGYMVPIIGMSAAVPPMRQEEITDYVGLRSPNVMRQTMER